jgi:hypothetical protein
LDTYTNIAILIPIDEALDYFNDSNIKNKTYFSKAPNTSIITGAITKQIEEARKEYFFSA